jgi:rhodanese-related sulfurtransferase
MTEAKIIEISPKGVRGLLDDNDAILVDVRTPEEHAAEHIKEAILHPFAEFDAKKIKELAAAKKVIFHCNSGGRAKKAAEAYIAAGHEEVAVLKDSLQGWKQTELPTIIKKEKMSLERQVLTVAGSLVVTGVLLGNSFSSNWFFLSVLVGADLTYAGISGNCFLKKILIELPYNKKP